MRPVLKGAPGDEIRTAFGWIVAAGLTSSSDAEIAFKKKNNNRENRGSKGEDRSSRYRASVDPRSPIFVVLFFRIKLYLPERRESLTTAGCSVSAELVEL